MEEWLDIRLLDHQTTSSLALVSMRPEKCHLLLLKNVPSARHALAAVLSRAYLRGMYLLISDGTFACLPPLPK